VGFGQHYDLWTPLEISWTNRACSIEKRIRPMPGTAPSMIEPLCLREFFRDAARDTVELNATMAGGFRYRLAKSHHPCGIDIATLSRFK
jgi:hypothetical protein